MKLRDGQIEGDLFVQEPTEFVGLVTGKIGVAQGVTLHLYGVCCGDLVLQPGSTAIIFGTVGGNLLNQGSAELRGRVSGSVFTSGGHFRALPKAAVDGKIHQENLN